jgi:hypothetical protein
MLRWHRCGGAGLEARGGDVVLLVAHLEPKVMEAAPQAGVGTIAEGRNGRHVAAVMDPDALGGPQLLWQVICRSLSAAVLCLGMGCFFNFVNLNNKFIHYLFIVYTWFCNTCGVPYKD